MFLNYRANYTFEESKKLFKENSQFLKWYEKELKSSCLPFLRLTEVRNMVDLLVKWYKVKYPDAEIEKINGSIEQRFHVLEQVSYMMDVERLKKELPEPLQIVLEGEYSSARKCYVPIDKKGDNGETRIWERDLVLSITKVAYDTGDVEDYMLLASTDGMIRKHQLNGLEEYTGFVSTSTSLSELYGVLSQFSLEELDYSELKKCVERNLKNLELRNWIFTLAAQDLMTDSLTNPQYGTYRARLMIRDMKKRYGNLMSFTVPEKRPTKQPVLILKQ